MVLRLKRGVAWYRGLVENTGRVGKLLLLGLPLGCVCAFCILLLSPLTLRTTPQTPQVRAVRATAPVRATGDAQGIAEMTDTAGGRLASPAAEPADKPTRVVGPTTNVFPTMTVLAEQVSQTETAAPPSEASPTEPVRAPEGLGITRAEIQSNFEQIEFVFQPGEPVDGQENVVGRAENTLVQLVGPAADVTEASVIVIVDSTDETQRTRAAVHMIALLVIVQWVAKFASNSNSCSDLGAAICSSFCLMNGSRVKRLISRSLT